MLAFRLSGFLAFSFFRRDNIKQYKKPFAVILAGGKGTRLGVLTNYRTKPAVSFGGKYRIIDWVLSNCRVSEINDVFVITQFEPISLRQHIGEGVDWDFDSSDKVITVLHPKEEVNEERIQLYKGTADAVRQNLERILSLDPELVLILAGDHIYTEDYSNIVNSHIERESDLSIYAQPISEEDVREYGIIKVDESFRIVDFVEKPKEKSVLKEFQLSHSMQEKVGITDSKQKYLASMGIYLFSQPLLRDAMEMHGNDFGKNIIPQAIKEYDVYAFPFSGYWRDVGLIKNFYRTNMDLFTDKREEILSPCLNTNTRYRHLPSPFILGNIDKSIISNGCTIRESSSIHKSILGYQVKVEKGAVIEDSILLGASRHFRREGKMIRSVYTRIGSNSHLKKVILDKNVWIGEDVEIGVEQFSMEERKERLSSIGLEENVDYNLTEEGILVIRKQDVFRDEPIIPDEFKC